MPSTYPVALAVTKDEIAGVCGVVECERGGGARSEEGNGGAEGCAVEAEFPTAAGTHPCALEIAPDGKTMYVALANRDAVAAVNLDKGQFAVKGYFDTRLPGQSYFGAEPEALAVSADGSRLYVGNAGVGCGGGDGHDEADGTKAAARGNGGADRIFADGVDADGDDDAERQAVCRDGEGQGNGAE